VFLTLALFAQLPSLTQSQSLPTKVSDLWYSPQSTTTRVPDKCTPNSCNATMICCSVGGDYWCAPANSTCCQCIPLGSCYTCNGGDHCLSIALCSTPTGFWAGILAIIAIIILVIACVAVTVFCCISKALCCCL